VAKMSLEKVALLTGGKLLAGSPEKLATGFEFDSREIKPGDLFFALVAERNGHDFIPDAFRRGAVGAVVSEERQPPHPDFGLIRVDDTLEALQLLARKVLQEYQVKIIGITGSVGKTTVKEYTASLLAGQFSVLKAKKSFNNQIGVPYTLLQLHQGHQIAVLEMGMNHAGEIKHLTTIAPPDVAVITGIKPVHTEFFSSLEEIAAAKYEILAGARPQAVAVLAGDDPYCQQFARIWSGQVITFGFGENCHLRVTDLHLEGWAGYSFTVTYQGKKLSLKLPVVYESYVYNFAAAAAAASALGLSLEKIKEQALNLGPLPQRGEIIPLANDIHLINDVYNSNPAALQMALRNLSSLPARRRIAVLGDMLELGREGDKFHFQLGQELAQLGWDWMITVGQLSRHFARGAIAAGLPSSQVLTLAEAGAAAEALHSLLQPGDLILVKGSRRMKMEQIIEHLTGGEK